MKLKKIVSEGLTWRVDPNEQFNEAAVKLGVEEEDIIRVCLSDTPAIIKRALNTTTGTLDSFVAGIDSQNCGFSRYMSGEVEEGTLIFRYPEDPDCHPICILEDNRNVIDTQKVTFALYEHNVVYVEIGGKSMISRIG